MKTLVLILAALAVLAVAAQAYVRFAPVQVDRWHVPPEMPGPGTGDWTQANGHFAARIVAGRPDDVLARIDRIARAWPRTRLIAGGVETGAVTYETRSAFWGFPDYTTVAAEAEAAGSKLRLYGRARFGASDLGVNKTRIAAWLDQLGT